ncbi:hypothetical protein [Parabacteroides goldsteinii]|uniref:hypothetical protein n=1 Tax=Parabacteroides goldsteinii TaxID=328812 RepID=UPI001DE7C187|nr:hypothetical protein [Parabacteroides goldsteinii]MBS6574760.1 hypothetical protein [Parabacteroides goldsteinii]
MSRTIKDIYDEAVKERNKRLELAEFSNDSKLSVMNGITWAFAAVIYSFETLLDVFTLDISTAINSRMNGTPLFYVNALLQYQKGDELTVREDGLAFGYNEIDETKRIISQVSYSESSNDVNLDNKLILKVAQGEKGHLSPVSGDDLVLITSYLNKIKFAGTRIEVTSSEGDILIPRLSVYYDGAVRETEIYDLIEEKLNDYMMNIDFDSSIYVSKIIEAIKKAEHVTDVYIDEGANPEQGIFIASYDADGNLMPLIKTGRMTHTVSGYLKESSRKGQEKDIPGFREAIKLIVG